MSTITAEQMIAIGGRSWTSSHGDIHRIYLNLTERSLARLVGLEVSRYRSGNISGATIADRSISNAEAGRLLKAKLWWEDGEIMITGPSADVAEILRAAVLAEIGKFA